ncbi:DUF2634 domain-containing protein [Pollutimonas sp. H1-120]|uniref:DUF2634 domain-containing protein n=1 Tax=Pollutimonas sp. H1-120 TaxID=3148824 RepID=UPI003B5217DF
MVNKKSGDSSLGGKPTRDDFSQTTRNTLALRAGYRCSFTDCGIPTAGPSDEALDKHISIGVAAHISAASLGGARYDENMTSAERTHIRNGIWLCQTHSRLIDVNPVAYPVEALHKMKEEHEDKLRSEMSGRVCSSMTSDFIALGPDIIFLGELVSVEAQAWSFRLDNFFVGDLGALIKFSERFDTVDPYDQYVLVNAIGDGRQLSKAPSWRKMENCHFITVTVMESYPRIDAHKLPRSLALDDKHDLFVENGDLATISGFEALSQTIKMCLSTRRGEVFFSLNYGTRIGEYSKEFVGSPWLPQLIKLETIRMACIPHAGVGSEKPVTPLKCIQKVVLVEQLDACGADGWAPFRFQLEIEGVGAWAGELTLFIAKDL